MSDADVSSADVSKERIRKACREVMAVRPAYTEILKFYEAVFLAQEEAKKELEGIFTGRIVPRRRDLERESA